MWTDAYAQTAGQAPAANDPLSLIVNFGYIPLLFLIMYLLLIRPQQQRQKALQNQLAALKKGDRVLTAGGILGDVVGTRSNDKGALEVVILRIAENVKVEFAPSAITAVIPDKTESAK